jgi:IclR family transcriptional regulator, KDG regulon repressor
MRGISAPIRNDAGEVVAAVGLAGPATRLSKKAIAAFVPHVIETADLVSSRLGYRPAAGIARKAVP